jgi:hypothetical protein
MFEHAKELRRFGSASTLRGSSRMRICGLLASALAISIHAACHRQLADRNVEIADPSQYPRNAVAAFAICARSSRMPRGLSVSASARARTARRPARTPGALADPGAPCVGGTGEGNGCVGDRQGPAVGLQQPIEHVHQRRFAGAVPKSAAFLPPANEVDTGETRDGAET